VFDASVFVNCPFDAPYKPLLDAQLFAIHDCGFLARIALEANGSGESRLDKITRLILESRLSIHDICRVELTPQSSLPRFNMPFECGLAFGALRYRIPQSSPARDILVLDALKSPGGSTLSDLSGSDIAYHENQIEPLIRAVRQFLAQKAPSTLPAGVSVRGHAAIYRRFLRFQKDLPVMTAQLQIAAEEIASLDYLGDWIGLAVRWQAAFSD
jgi:hypothetical protein